MAAEFGYDDAQTAMTAVLNKYGSYVDRRLKELPVYTVYQFCDPVRYRLLFTQAYESVFKEANRVLIPKLITHEDCPGFVMPDLGNRVFSRRIFIANRACAAGQSTQRGTLYHEYIHFLSHKSFYPDYYNCGDPFAPFVVEAATELLTRLVGGSDVSTRRNYQVNFLKAFAWVTGGSGRLRELLLHVFEGTPCGITSITP